MTRSVIQFRVSEDEKRTIEQRAAEAGLKVSELLRQLALDDGVELPVAAAIGESPPESKERDEPKRPPSRGWRTADFTR